MGKRRKGKGKGKKRPKQELTPEQRRALDELRRKFEEAEDLEPVGRFQSAHLYFGVSPKNLGIVVRNLCIHPMPASGDDPATVLQLEVFDTEESGLIVEIHNPKFLWTEDALAEVARAADVTFTYEFIDEANNSFIWEIP